MNFKILILLSVVVGISGFPRRSCKGDQDLLAQCKPADVSFALDEYLERMDKLNKYTVELGDIVHRTTQARDESLKKLRVAQDDAFARAKLAKKRGQELRDVTTRRTYDALMESNYTAIRSMSDEAWEEFIVEHTDPLLWLYPHLPLILFGCFMFAAISYNQSDIRNRKAAQRARFAKMQKLPDDEWREYINKHVCNL
jgi:hypothetical protein